jgi:hypothetical protein
VTNPVELDINLANVFGMMISRYLVVVAVAVVTGGIGEFGGTPPFLMACRNEMGCTVGTVPFEQIVLPTHFPV